MPCSLDCGPRDAHRLRSFFVFNFQCDVRTSAKVRAHRKILVCPRVGTAFTSSTQCITRFWSLPPVRSIGLSGFDNPLRDPKTDELKKHVGQGVKIKMDDAGNILIRRYAKSNVYIKSTASAPNEETAIGADILKLPQQALEAEKIVKVRPGSVICILFAIKRTSGVLIDRSPGFRHEEIPIEREPRAAPRLPGPAAPRDAVPVRRGVRQVGERDSRLSHLGADHQCGRHGHAEEQAAAR